MAAITTIQKDEYGLYAVCGGWIARPFYGTTFQEGDKVKTHHFGGSMNAGVTVPNKPETHNFKRMGIHEIWSTTGMTADEYRNRDKGRYPSFEKHLKKTYEWYKEHNKNIGLVYKEINSKFIK